MLYQYREPNVQKLDTTPDPLFNPNEVTRVKDILDLHSRGVRPYAIVQQLRGEITDERSDYAKLDAPNYESDKLFPSLPRVVAQNAQYSEVYNEYKERVQSDIDVQEQLKSIVSPPDTPVSDKS